MVICSSIKIDVVSGDRRGRGTQMRAMEYLSGRYQRVGYDGNNWPFYKSVKKTPWGEIYLWHDSNYNKWRITADEYFLARKTACYMYIKTSGQNSEKDVTELDERWMEFHGDDEWKKLQPSKSIERKYRNQQSNFRLGLIRTDPFSDHTSK